MKFFLLFTLLVLTQATYDCDPPAVTLPPVPNMKLKHISIIARHGDRAPMSNGSTLSCGDHICQPGELTQHGKEQHFKFGKETQKYLSQYEGFEKLTKKSISVRSTKIERSILSAETFFRPYSKSNSISRATPFLCRTIPSSWCCG